MDQRILDVVERVASMMAAGTPQVQIAQALGLSEGRISQLKETEEFREVFAAKQAAKFEEQEEFNQGWDGVEKAALKVVTDNLKWNKNPDFALKAAMLANKATRRGAGNQPLPVNMGTHAVVNLSVAFVNKIQSMHMPGPPDGRFQSQLEQATAPGKLADLLSPDGVVSLLKPQAKARVEAQNHGMVFGEMLEGLQELLG